MLVAWLSMANPARDHPADYARTYHGNICADGWNSPSSGSGTCSHHGGIAKRAGYDYVYPNRVDELDSMYGKHNWSLGSLLIGPPLAVSVLFMKLRRRKPMNPFETGAKL